MMHLFIFKKRFPDAKRLTDITGNIINLDNYISTWIPANGELTIYAVDILYKSNNELIAENAKLVKAILEYIKQNPSADNFFKSVLFEQIENFYKL